MRLLIVSDSPAIASGQARMVRELARRFVADGVHVAVAGWHEFVAPPFESPGYQIFPILKQKPETLGPLLADERPDIVLAMGDPWDFAWLSAERAKRPSWLLCGYLNIETDTLPTAMEVVLDGFDQVRVTSQAGARACARSEITAVHLGVDPLVFAPGPRPDAILGRDIRDRYTVLINAQNTNRKNVIGALRALAQADELCRKRILGIFNSQVISPIGSNLLNEIIEQDLEDLVVFEPRNHNPLDTVPDARVAELYRAADALLITSTSEGFCLPVLEAMATRTLVIAPAHSSLPELLDPSALDFGPDARGVLYLAGAPMMTHQGAWAHAPDVDEAANAVGFAIKGIGDKSRAAILGRAQVFAAQRTWDVCYGKIAEMVSQLRPKLAWPIPGAPAGTGAPIDGLLRARARHVAKEAELAVIKIGGLGDMLMVTTVIRAAATKWGGPVAVFCNQFPEVFEPMPEIARVVHIKSTTQELVVRSVADAFPVCLDLRSVSRAYGSAAGDPAPLSVAFRWAYDHWASSLTRVDTFGDHMTALMLKTLGLPVTDLRPIYTARATPPVDVPEAYAVICPGTGALGPLKRPESTWWQRLISQIGLPVVHLGAASEPQMADIDGRGWSLPVSAQVLEQARMVIAVDSGLAHLSTAVRNQGHSPTVVLFGPTPVSVYGYTENINLTKQQCRCCFWDTLWGVQRCAMGAQTCLNLPDVDDVVAALK